MACQVTQALGEATAGAWGLPVQPLESGLGPGTLVPHLKCDGPWAQFCRVGVTHLKGSSFPSKYASLP